MRAGADPAGLRVQLGTGDRTFGARLTAALLAGELSPGPWVIEAGGVAGQGFGAFLATGLELRLKGEAQDHLAKGLSGGRVVLRPAESAAPGAVLAGNTVLYGATGGELFLAGRAGERFAVRNSGAVAVVEGCGDLGCEYMTAGAVLVLGPVGQNFGAGMTGGKAWALAAAGDLEAACSAEVTAGPVPPDELDELATLLRAHASRTGSAQAWSLLAAWPRKAVLLRRITPLCAREETGPGRREPAGTC